MLKTSWIPLVGYKRDAMENIGEWRILNSLYKTELDML